MRIKTYHSVFRRHASQPVNTQSSIVLSSLRQRKQAPTLYWWQNCGNRAKSLKLKCFDFALSVRIIRELMQQRRRWLRKRHLKSAVALLKIYRDCSISFSSSNVGNFFFWSWIVEDCIKVQEKKKKVVVHCSRPPQNVKSEIFTS